LYRQVLNIQKLCNLPTECISLISMDLTTTNSYFSIHHRQISFYNRAALCALLGTY
jgi:hypothetical protein